MILPVCLAIDFLALASGDYLGAPTILTCHGILQDIGTCMRDAEVVCGEGREVGARP
jgi:hypothetical protein